MSLLRRGIPTCCCPFYSQLRALLSQKVLDQHKRNRQLKRLGCSVENEHRSRDIMADAPEEGDKKKSKKDDEMYEGDLKDGKQVYFLACQFLLNRD